MYFSNLEEEACYELVNQLFKILRPLMIVSIQNIPCH